MSLQIHLQSSYSAAQRVESGGNAEVGHAMITASATCLLVRSHVYTSSNRRISPRVLCSEAQERVLGRSREQPPPVPEHGFDRNAAS
jgi:hypothetical protein